MIVVDASVVAAWYLEPQNAVAREAREALAEHAGVVPGNFHAELAQALFRSERLRLFSAEDVLQATEEIAGLRLTIRLARFSTLVSMARKYNISAYDAAYLAVASDADATLATLDANLQTVAKSAKLLWMPPRRKR